MSIGEQTHQAIMSQPQAWAATLAALPQVSAALKGLGRTKPTHLYWVGCGSSYFISQSLAALTQEEVGIAASAPPASEMALFPKTVLHPRYKPWLVAISRSGQTSETLQAIKTFRKAYPDQPVIAITCEGGSRLANAADVVLVAQVEEPGIVQTVSLSTMYLIGLQVVALWSKQTLQASLAQRGADLLKQQQRLALEVGSNQDLKRFFFLGSGPLHGLANESRLKLKEMSLVHSEAFHTLEFRHGLGANVDSHSLVIGLLAEKKSIYQHELGVLADMKAQGGHILTLGPMRLPNPPGQHIELAGAGLSLLPLYLPWLQLMAYYRALAVGRNPDQPVNLKAFIELDGLG